MKINVEVGQIQGKRDYQQDDLSFRNIVGGSKLVFLADGMGGYKGGEKASELVIKTFSKYPTESNDDGDFLKKLLHKANQEITLYKEKNPEVSQMGTTLVAMLITNTTCQWISVGDSLLYHIRDDEIKRINANHSVAGLLNLQLAKGEITKEEADKNPNKHMLTSALTGGEISIIDLSKKIQIQPNDIFILASDGVETISKEDILRIIISSDGDMSLAVKRILGEVEKKEKPNQDNATIMIITQSQNNNVNDTISKISGISNNKTNISNKEKKNINQNGKFTQFIKPLGIATLGLIILLSGIFLEKKYPIFNGIFSDNNNTETGNLLTSEVTSEKKLGVIEIDKRGTLQNEIGELLKRTDDANITKKLMDINSTLVEQKGDIDLERYDQNLVDIKRFIDDKELKKERIVLQEKITKMKSNEEYKKKFKAIEKSKKKEILKSLKEIEIGLKDVNTTKKLMEINNTFNSFLKDINCTKFAKGEEEKDRAKDELKKKRVLF